MRKKGIHHLLGHLNLKRTIVVILAANLLNLVLHVCDGVRSGSLGALVSIGPPALSTRESIEMTFINAEVKGNVLDTTWVVGGVNLELTCRYNLHTLVGERVVIALDKTISTLVQKTHDDIHHVLVQCGLTEHLHQLHLLTHNGAIQRIEGLLSGNAASLTLGTTTLFLVAGRLGVNVSRQRGHGSCGYQLLPGIVDAGRSKLKTINDHSLVLLLVTVNKLLPGVTAKTKLQKFVKIYWIVSHCFKTLICYYWTNLIPAGLAFLMLARAVASLPRMALSTGSYISPS